MGNPRWRIALFHILPNIMPALLVQATLSIAAAIIAEAALSFLGLGQQPPAPSWGSMLNAAQRFLTNAPWMALWPGLAIFSWCCRSTWSATACATRSIRGSGEASVSTLFTVSHRERSRASLRAAGRMDSQALSPWLRERAPSEKIRSPSPAPRGGNPSRIRDRSPAGARNARSGRIAWRRGEPVHRQRPDGNHARCRPAPPWCPSSRSRTRRAAFHDADDVNRTFSFMPSGLRSR
jgi:hypothetical protein